MCVCSNDFLSPINVEEETMMACDASFFLSLHTNRYKRQNQYPLWIIKTGMTSTISLCKRTVDREENGIVINQYN